MDSEILAVRALKGNKQNDVDEAFCYLYKKYCKLVYTCILALVKDSRDAEELTDDTFVKVFNNREKICEERNFKFYLVTIAKNLAIDFLRKKQTEIVLDEDYIFNCVQSEDQKEWFDIRHDMLQHLSKEETEIILAHIVFGETFQDISNYYNVSIHTIKSKYFRAIKKFQKEMRDDCE